MLPLSSRAGLLKRVRSIKSESITQERAGDPLDLRTRGDRNLDHAGGSTVRNIFYRVVRRSDDTVTRGPSITGVI